MTGNPAAKISELAGYRPDDRLPGRGAIDVALGQQIVCPDAAIVATPRGRGETVLVVEDDTTVRLSSPVGLFLGTVVEVGGGWRTSRVVAGGQLRTQRSRGRLRRRSVTSEAPRASACL